MEWNHVITLAAAIGGGLFGASATAYFTWKQQRAMLLTQKLEDICDGIMEVTASIETRRFKIRKEVLFGDSKSVELHSYTLENFHKVYRKFRMYFGQKSVPKSFTTFMNTAQQLVICDENRDEELFDQLHSSSQELVEWLCKNSGELTGASKLNNIC